MTTMDYSMAIEAFEDFNSRLKLSIHTITFDGSNSFAPAEYSRMFTTLNVLLDTYFPSSSKRRSEVRVIQNGFGYIETLQNLQEYIEHSILLGLKEKYKIETNAENMNNSKTTSELGKYQESVQNELNKRYDQTKYELLEYRLDETLKNYKTTNEKLQSKMEELANQKGLADQYATRVINAENDVQKITLDLVSVQKELVETQERLTAKQKELETLPLELNTQKKEVDRLTARIKTIKEVDLKKANDTITELRNCQPSNIWLLVSVFFAVSYVIFTIPLVFQQQYPLQKQIISEGVLILVLIISHYKDKMPQWVIFALGTVIAMLQFILP